MVAGQGFEPWTEAYETSMIPFQHPAIIGTPSGFCHRITRLKVLYPYF